MADHLVSTSCQEHDSSACVGIYRFKNIELIWVYSSFRFHVTADCHEDTGEETVKEAEAQARHHLLWNFLSDCFEVRKWGVHNQ